ncbi:hypothetical protein BJ085DRAFT_30287 [Dimargaris cristalligena]|uniref:Uncharacterized protein n=1 Tax=Dimargaris cristalligena TaxID=215637 RepID=A0A4P9ZPP1_9FUNG|nr:hypothetical protein BJ085DRAFT_30287 [Dimargaris cristalligena]|eukprot:RKP35168.1 hypothetical protein BJ085DRAFT_30287 [Dimargaris cristalligena]
MAALRAVNHELNNNVLYNKYPIDNSMESIFEFYYRTPCTQDNLSIWIPQIRKDPAAAVPLFLGPYLNKGLSVLYFGKRMPHSRRYKPKDEADQKRLKRKYPLLYMIEQGFAESAATIAGILGDYLVSQDPMPDFSDESIFMGPSTVSQMYWVARDMLSMGILMDARESIMPLAIMFHRWSGRWLDNLLLINLAVRDLIRPATVPPTSTINEETVFHLVYHGLDLLYGEPESEDNQIRSTMREHLQNSLLLLYQLWAIELFFPETAEFIEMASNDSADFDPFYVGFTFTMAQDLNLNHSVEYMNEVFGPIPAVPLSTFPGEDQSLVLEYASTAFDRDYNWDPKEKTTLLLELVDL